MKLPEVQIKGAESLGRHNLSAVGNVARSQAGLANAQANALGHVSKLVGDIAQTQDRMEYDKAVAEYKENLTEWQMKFGSKEFFDGEEIQGMVSDPERLKENINGDDGKNVSVFRKNIPAYEVYANMLDNKMRGLQKTYGLNIRNNNLAHEFVNSTDELRNQKMLRETIKASQQQHQQERTDSKVRITQYAASGQLKEALFETSKFNGTDFEKAELAEKARHAAEKYQYIEAVRTENLPVMVESLATLKSDKYSDAGVLTTEENLSMQNLLEGEIGRLQQVDDSAQRQQEAELEQYASDVKVSLEDGHDVDHNNVVGTMDALNTIDKEKKAIGIRRAHKKQPIIKAMWINNPESFGSIIEAGVRGQGWQGATASAIKLELEAKANQIENAIMEDTTGVYIDRVVKKAMSPDQDGFYAQSLQYSKAASQHYSMMADPLSNRAAEQDAGRLQHMTTTQKVEYIRKVNGEVPSFVDRNRLYEQLDSKGAGRMSVYSDLVDRGDDGAIKAIEEGSRLRREERGLKIIPDDIDRKLRVELEGTFALNAMRLDYSEAIKDVYAFLSEQEAKYNQESSSGELLKMATKMVLGNIVEYKGNALLLPNNEFTARSWSQWVRQLPGEYIDGLGGVIGKDSYTVARSINSGDFTLKPSPKRGEYLVTDAVGDTLMTRDKKGNIRPFIFRYDESIDYTPYIPPNVRRRNQGGTRKHQKDNF